MKKLSIAEIDEIAPHRPPGYREELLALAKKVTELTIELDPEDYNKLWHKYRNPVPVVSDRASLLSYFDRVVVINLDRRPDRMEELEADLQRANWPFLDPTRFRAVDASKLPQHIAWKSGAGAWGCMQSHRQILQEALMDDVKNLLVLEDDVTFASNFDEKVLQFLRDVPSDWDQIMLGGQLCSRDGRQCFSKPVVPGVVRVGGCERTHAYAVRGRGMLDLYAKWCGAVGHCDHVMGPWQHDYNVYAPDPFLAGQREGKSDISGADNAAKFWVAPRPDAPVILLRGPLHVMEAIRSRGFHGGRMRTQGIDNGLQAIVDENSSLEKKVARMRNWIHMIQSEGRSMSPECDCVVFHPNLNEQVVRLAAGSNLKVIYAKTASEFFAKVG